MTPSLLHRVRNLIQSAMLIGGMALIAWAVVRTIAGPGLTLLIVCGSALGLLLAPSLPKSVMLSAYGARRLDSHDFPQGVSILAELAGRASLPRVPALYYVPSRLRTHPPTEKRVRRLRELTGPGRPWQFDEPARLPRFSRTSAPRFGPWGIYK